MSKPTENTEPRYIPPGSCTWCGHKPHDGTCKASIRTANGKASRTEDCPCKRHLSGLPVR